VAVSEHSEQASLVSWANTLESDLPGLALLYAIPNGGRRDIRTAIKLKAEGVKAGVPDLCLPVARGGYHGAYIEMKFGKNQTSPEQKKWIADLRTEGHFVTVCWGWQDAADTIEQYLAGDITREHSDG
jgi:hypothetical protein